jgi:uncharacterized RDD family membrane protein YckC
MVVRTPENLEVSYELSGASTRAAAYLVDVALMSLLLSVFQNLIVAFATPLPPEFLPYVAAILGIVAFISFNSYFILFELLWSGQSPGKRMVGIRVVKSGGFALSVTDSLLRNLLRAVDFLPVGYGVGLVSLLTTRSCQRIGDLVAGTLVVYQEQAASDSLFSTKAVEAAALPLAIVKLGSLPQKLVETCDEFLRTRGEMAPKYRQQIASDLLKLVETLSELAPASHQSDEAFLAAVVSQCGQIPQGS